jgi:hypothetical protein
VGSGSTGAALRLQGCGFAAQKFADYFGKGRSPRASERDRLVVLALRYGKLKSAVAIDDPHGLQFAETFMAVKCEMGSPFHESQAISVHWTHNTD